METGAGIWKLNPGESPYRLEHINLIRTPNNRTSFHRQPRLFLSMRDVFFYIKRHDEKLTLSWQENEYLPDDAIV